LIICGRVGVIRCDRVWRWLGWGAVGWMSPVSSFLRHEFVWIGFSPTIEGEDHGSSPDVQC